MALNRQTESRSASSRYTPRSDPAIAPERYFLFRRTRPESHSHLLFSTRDPRIATNFRRHDNFKVKEISTLPSDSKSVSDSCIIELSNGKVKIDEELLQGEHKAAQTREILRDVHGFVDPDVVFVGAYAPSRRVGVVQGFFDEIVELVNGRGEKEG